MKAIREDKMRLVRKLEKALGITPPPALVEAYADLEEEERAWPGSLSQAYRRIKAQALEGLGVLQKVRSTVEALGWDLESPELAPALENAIKASGLDEAIVDVDADDFEAIVEAYGVVGGNPVHFYVTINRAHRKVGGEMATENIPSPDL